MRLKNILILNLTVAVHFAFCAASVRGQQLLNMEFGVGTASEKVGYPAVGQSTADFWNLYSRDDGTGGYRTFGQVDDLRWADGAVSSVDLTVANAPGAWQNGTTDP